ncbi:MAG TPA: YfhO family protein, partial [Thermoanaerobaculia bacterium]|nr:YfhO family protein [Thermoanaerobaculia bacterium]
MNLTWLYVALLYAIAVWIARRCGTAFRWRIAVLFYALVLIFLWRPMTGAYVNVPVDCLTRLPPWWGATRHVVPQNCEINDIYMQMVPWAGQVRQQWKSFQFPLWNPTEGSGTVLLANGQSAALSPLRLLALPLSLGQSFTAEAAMKLLIALTFTFLFCRRRGFSELASATGAAAFSFGTFIVVWLHFPHATVAAYLPAVLYQIDLLAERVTYGRIVFAAAIWTAVLFGGHPETALHIGVISAAMLIWILLVERPFATQRDMIRFLGSLAVAMFIAALLSAPFLVPFAEALTKSQRYQLLKVHPWSVGFTDAQSMLLLLQPHFYGATPADRTWGPAVAESICGWSGILGFAGWIALLLDAIVRRSRWRTREMFFVVMAPLVLAIITDFPIIGTFFNDVFALAANARVRLLLSFVMAILAASMVDLIQQKRVLAAIIGIALVLGGLFALLQTTHFPNAWIHDNTVLSMLPSVLVLALAAAAAATVRARDVLLMLAFAATIGEIWAVDRGWNSVVSDALMYPETPLIRRLEQLRTSEPSRIVGLGAAMFPNTGAPFGFEDIRVHDPMGNGRYLGVLRVLTNYDSEAYFAHWKDMKTRFLDFLNVKYIVAAAGTELPDMQRYPLVYKGIDGVIFRNNDVLPRFYAARNVLLEFKGTQFAMRLAKETDWAHTGVVKTLPVESDQMRQDLLAPRPLTAP